MSLELLLGVITVGNSYLPDVTLVAQSKGHSDELLTEGGQ